MNLEVLYTIIIPHKNIPFLLQRCIDSIPTRKDVQIIIVDDNSSPEIVDFSDFPGYRREDVEVIYTKEGRGAGYARNVGLKYMKGKWLLFADADDFFLPGFWEILDRYSQTDYDLITFRAESADSDTLDPVPSRQKHYAEIYEDMDLEILKYSNDVPWGKMISSRLIGEFQLHFDETPAANDAMFSAKVDYCARRVAACSAAIYCATIRSSSLCYGVVLENLLARVSVSCRYNHFLRGIGRKDKTIYSYGRVKECRENFGRRGYYKALWIYLSTECAGNIYITYRDLLKNKCRKRNGSL